MNKLLTSTLATSVLLASASAAFANPVVYGKMNVTAQSGSEEVKVNGVKAPADNFDLDELTSNASRIGIKGKTKLTDTLNAIYKAEFEISVDEGGFDKTREDADGTKYSDKTTMKARNTYIGLQGNFGTVIAGKHDTPLKLAQKKIDLFNDLPVGDIKNVFVGENRADNVVAYTTPKFAGGFSASIAAVAGEEENTADDGFADALSYSLSYTADNVYVAVAADSEVGGSDTLRLVGQFDLGAVTLGAMWQDAESSDSAAKGGAIGSIKGPLKVVAGELAVGDFHEQDGFLLSAKVDLADNWVLRAQYAESESESEDGVEEAETEQLAVGIDYKFSKKTKVFGYYSMIEANGSDATDKVDVEFDTVALGIEHKF